MRAAVLVVGALPLAGSAFRLEAPRAPGRCPVCKSGSVLLPVFKVEKAEG